MGEMSSIVSRRPPDSVSTSQLNDFFWMSIRLGTSRTFSRRANERRVRGASTEAKTATPRDGRGPERGTRDHRRSGRSTPPAWVVRARGEPGGDKARPANIAQGLPEPLWGRVGAHGPRPARTPYVAERALRTAAAIGRRNPVYRSVQGGRLG